LDESWASEGSPRAKAVDIPDQFNNLYGPVDTQQKTIGNKNIINKISK